MSFVYTTDYFMRYSEELDNLLLCLNIDTFPDVGNLLIEGIYNVLANYLTCLSHVDEVLRDTEESFTLSGNPEFEQFVMSLSSQSDHIYLLSIEPILYNISSYKADFDPLLAIGLYEQLLDDKDDQAEIFRLTEASFTLTTVIRDILFRDIVPRLGEYALRQPSLPLYMNEIPQFDGTTALQLIIYEPIG